MPYSVEGLSESQLRELERLLTAGSQDRAEPEESELVAYFVPEGPAPAPAELRVHAARSLPASHVPVRFVAVAELPRLANGKLDRRALLNATCTEGMDPEAAASAELPSDDVERWLAAVWAAVLDVPVPSLRADFFAIGGSSLRAVQVLARVETVIGVELRLAGLFENPTLGAFAAMVKAQSVRVEGFDEIVAVAAEVYAQEAPGSVPAATPRFAPSH
ncbi:phosphopantetheine-binding protein [Streptomyces sp. NBC_01537]|uniref:phosphopantetheine-binding protein n=1 Tax=Streptomyces sp. NBC_01537 TaxID=2903896 RepID=UPI00386976F6